MTFGESELLAGLRGLGLEAGDAVLVHSSLSSLGWVSGGAPTLIGALLAAVGPGGTVLFPALTGSETDSPDAPPFCDVRRTPTWVGRVPETALAHPEAVRSCHPTHSVCAIGARAEELTAAHEHALTPCGVGSPYVRLAAAGGKILLLGVNHTRNTTFHTAEELEGVDYVFIPGGPLHCTVRDRDGVVRELWTPIHRWDIPRQFEAMHPALCEAGIVRPGGVCNAAARIMSAQALIDFLVAALRADPRCLCAGA